MNFGKRNCIKKAAVFTAFTLLLVGSAGSSYPAPRESFVNQKEDVRGKNCRGECHEKWMIGDFHNHTTFTDGSWPMNDLIGSTTIAPFAFPDTTGLYKQGTAATAFRNGLDFFTNSEHGGVRDRDGFGRNWNNTTTYPTLPAIGDPTNGRMWRWQSLIRTSDISGYAGPAYLGAYDWIETIRANYPEKIVMTGMEWNVPGHEHGSTGIVAGSSLPIAEFEYRFDNSDKDGEMTSITSTAMGWADKKINSYYSTANGYPDYSTVLGLNLLHNKTIDAVKWMQTNYSSTGYIIPAHVERAGCSVGGYSIAAFRDMNNNGPDVAFGFEGVPGHDRASNRGEFGTGACGGGTYGGAGTYIATVGGLWDNLLADGRRFFNFDNSDFHDPANDFWPGEYEKTYVMVKDEDQNGNYTQEEVIKGLRSGNSFSVHGDLINELDFRIFHGASIKNPSETNSATMGETLAVEPGDKITIQIRFKSPDHNNCRPGVNTASPSHICNPPVVHHVQLIQGRVNPTKADKFLGDGVTPNPDFYAIDPAVAEIAQIFDSSNWKTDDGGFTTMTFAVPSVQNDMFFRIRGTNVGFGVEVKDESGRMIYGTDNEGNPLINTPGTNNANVVWDDLWFYSNPIFVKIQ